MQKNEEILRKKLKEIFGIQENDGVVHHYTSEREIIRRIEKQEKGTLILMTGVQGSGKTTFVRNYCTNLPSINLDEYLEEELKKYEFPYTDKNFEEMDRAFCEKLREKLKEGIVILDAGATSIAFRMELRKQLEGSYTKLILLVLDPSKEQIRRNIKGEIGKRLRPGLWKDVDQEFEDLQTQIKNNILQIGVDEVYILKPTN